MRLRVFVYVAIVLAFLLVAPRFCPPDPAFGQVSAPAESGVKHTPPTGQFLALQQAIELALRHHPMLKVADANVRVADARVEQARSQYYPQVSANFDTAAGAGGINSRFVSPAGAMLRPNISQYAGGVIANQRLFDFGQTQEIVASSDLVAQAQRQDVSARRALVSVNIQRAYFTSLKRRRLVQIAEDTVKERGVITAQVNALYRQQLKSKLDLNLVQVELTNAESALVRAKNALKASFAELNRAMGIAGAEEYVLEDLPIELQPSQPLESLIVMSLTHPELQRAKGLQQAAEARVRATKKQYLPTVSAIASAGDYQMFDKDGARERLPTGGWWAVSGLISVPLFTGFLIENQVREAAAHEAAARATASDIEQALTQQVTNAYLDTVTFAQQIRLAEQQVSTTREALQLAQQRYKLGLGSIVEVTQSELAVTAAQTRLAEAQFDYKIAKVTLEYAAGGGLIPSSVPE